MEKANESFRCNEKVSFTNLFIYHLIWRFGKGLGGGGGGGGGGAGTFFDGTYADFSKFLKITTHPTSFTNGITKKYHGTFRNFPEWPPHPPHFFFKKFLFISFPKLKMFWHLDVTCEYRYILLCSVEISSLITIIILCLYAIQSSFNELCEVISGRASSSRIHPSEWKLLAWLEWW